MKSLIRSITGKVYPKFATREFFSPARRREGRVGTDLFFSK